MNVKKNENGILVIRFVPLGSKRIVHVFLVEYDVSVNKTKED